MRYQQAFDSGASGQGRLGAMASQSKATAAD
jgi:hypothetical protein